MTNNNVYLPSSSSTKSCDTSYSSSKEEMEVESMIQPYEWEPQASNEDFDEDRRFLTCGFQVKTRTKNSRYWISLLHLCFVLYGKIMLRMGVFISIAITFHSFAMSVAKVPLAQCSKVSLL